MSRQQSQKKNDILYVIKGNGRYYTGTKFIDGRSFVEFDNDINSRNVKRYYTKKSASHEIKRLNEMWFKCDYDIVEYKIG